jgi:hypothetical protein
MAPEAIALLAIACFALGAACYHYFMPPRGWGNDGWKP